MAAFLLCAGTAAGWSLIGDKCSCHSVKYAICSCSRPSACWTNRRRVVNGTGSHLLGTCARSAKLNVSSKAVHILSFEESIRLSEASRFLRRRLSRTATCTLALRRFSFCLQAASKSVSQSAHSELFLIEPCSPPDALRGATPAMVWQRPTCHFCRCPDARTPSTIALPSRTGIHAP